MRPSSSGPMSEMVARTGWPPLPYTSQNATGQALNAGLTFKDSNLSKTFWLPPPALASPDRSPLTSAMNTGTPMADRPWASACSVTVLPVPVAPVMRPWRLANPGSRQSSVWSFFATRSGEAMT